MLRNEVKEKDIIKFAAEAYMIMGGDPATFLRESAEWLYDCYLKTEDRTSLEAAAQIIYAYKELGLIYVEAKEIFDKIVIRACEVGIDVSLDNIYSAKKLRLKKTSIREVLGRWPKASKNQRSADSVVREILDCVSHGVLGARHYERGTGRIAFQLLVLEERAYLLDLEKRTIYVLDKEK